MTDQEYIKELKMRKWRGCLEARKELEWIERTKPANKYDSRWYQSDEAKEMREREGEEQRIRMAERQARWDKEDAERKAVEDAKRAEQERLDNCPDHQEYLRITANRNSDDNIDLNLDDHYKLAVYESDRFFETEARKTKENRELQQQIIDRRKNERKERISNLFYPVTRFWKYRSLSWIRIWMWWQGFKCDLILYGIIAIGVAFVIFMIMAIYWSITIPDEMWMSKM